MEKVVHVNQTQAPLRPSVIMPDQNKMVNPFPKSNNSNTVKMGLIAMLVVVLGIGTGWLLSGSSSAKTSDDTQRAVSGASVNNDKEAGLADESTFKDSAEGVLEDGGIDGEGTHHLTRPGGVSQNVYLTSTVIDLGSFAGKKVKVWGQTIKGKKAGWLMDVGKIKVVE